MTKKQLESTKWAKEFKKDCPSCYEEAIKFALDQYQCFNIYHNTELGVPMWSIAAIVLPSSTNDNFWMASFEVQRDAAALCEKMGWKYSIAHRRR